MAIKAKTNPKKGAVLAVESWPIARAKPYAANPRKNDNNAVAKVAASIEEYGFRQPIVVDEAGTIIAGHTRLLAARSLGLTEVPVHVATGLSPQQVRAYRLADNRTAQEAEWDDLALASELVGLQAAEFDLGLTGFDVDELARLLTPSTIDAAALDAEAVPDPPADPVTRLGDVIELGRHRLVCGDSTDAGAVALLLGEARPTLLHADPPYGMGKESEGVANDNLHAGKLDSFQMSWWLVWRKYLTDNASAYIWGTAPDLWRLWYSGGLASSERLTLRNEIVWAKSGAFGITSDGMRSYPPATERCLFFVLGEQGFNIDADNYWQGWEPVRSALKADCDTMGWGPQDIQRICGVSMYSHWFTESQWCFIPAKHYAKLQAAARDHDAFKRDHDAFKRDHDELKRDHDELKRDFYATRAYFNNTHDAMTDVWSFDRVRGDDRHGHATPKPVAMMERAIRSSSRLGDAVAEPFGGTGATLLASEVAGRDCYTMELDPRYCDVIVTRWETATGLKAVRP